MTYPGEFSSPRAPQPKLDMSSLMMLAVSLIAAVPLLLHSVGALTLQLRAETATATVVSGVPGQKSKTVTVTFVTRAGETVTTSLTAYGRYAKGEPIDLVYDRKDPTHLQDAARPLWIDGIFAIGTLATIATVINGLRRLLRRE